MDLDEEELKATRKMNGANKTKYIASVSFGKDSLAMLLMLIEKQYPLDEVIFYDTGMEFKAIYNIRDKMKQLLKEKNIKYTELKPEIPFEEKMLNITVHKRNRNITIWIWCMWRQMYMGNI